MMQVNVTVELGAATQKAIANLIAAGEQGTKTKYDMTEMRANAAAKGNPKKEAAAVEDTTDEPTEADLGTDDETADAEPEFTLKDVKLAVKTYATKNGNTKALALLAKFKVKNVNDLQAEQYGDLIKAAGKK